MHTTHESASGTYLSTCSEAFYLGKHIDIWGTLISHGLRMATLWLKPPMATDRHVGFGQAAIRHGRLQSGLALYALADAVTSGTRPIHWLSVLNLL